MGHHCIGARPKKWPDAQGPIQLESPGAAKPIMTERHLASLEDDHG